jgi:cellulose synthase operon protein C
MRWRLGAGSRAVVGQFEARRRGALPDPVAAARLARAQRPATRWCSQSCWRSTTSGITTRRPAIEQYEISVELAPDNAMVLNNLAWLYGEAGDPRGVELASRAHELAPDNPMIADTLGWILHRAASNERARRLLAGAVEGAPQASDIRYRYAVVLAEPATAPGRCARPARCSRTPAQPTTMSRHRSC